MSLELNAEQFYLDINDLDMAMWLSSYLYLDLMLFTCKSLSGITLPLFSPMCSLHDVLMELQKKQLQQLSDWLTVTEERIQKMESQAFAEDLESLQKQIEVHKVNGFCLFCNTHDIGKNTRKL